MKKSGSLLTNLLLSSTLFWGVPIAQGEELASEAILRVPTDTASYCHMKFPAMGETLFWDRPVLNGSATNSIDFYGSCYCDPVGG